MEGGEKRGGRGEMRKEVMGKGGMERRGRGKSTGGVDAPFDGS